jgi:hypothetical protein
MGGQHGVDGIFEHARKLDKSFDLSNQSKLPAGAIAFFAARVDELKAPLRARYPMR